jgi:hypothetical protein
MTQKKLTPEQQQRAFREAARAAECDESETAFEEKLKAIAKAKPPASRPPNRDPKS